MVAFRQRPINRLHMRRQNAAWTREQSAAAEHAPKAARGANGIELQTPDKERDHRRDDRDESSDREPAADGLGSGVEHDLSLRLRFWPEAGSRFADRLENCFSHTSLNLAKTVRLTSS